MDNKTKDITRKWAKRVARESTYLENTHSIEKWLYGLDTPVWTFISKDGIYSEEKTREWIKNVLKPLSTNSAMYEYLEAYFYLAVRAATTEYECFLIIDEDHAFGPNSETICFQGDQKAVSIGDLMRHFGWNDIIEIAGRIYDIVAPSADPEILSFMIPSEDEILEEEEELNRDPVAEATMDEDWENNPMPSPEEIYGEMSDEEWAKHKTNNDAAFQEKEERDAMKRYKSQMVRIREGFVNGKEFQQAVEKYYRYVKGIQEKYRRHFGYERILLQSLIKEFMLWTDETIFEDRETMVRINMQLIRARRIASERAAIRKSVEV